MTVSEALKIIRTNVYRTYPILNDNGQIVGSIDIETFFAIDKEKWDIPISELEVKKPLLVVSDQPLIRVIEEMLKSGEEHAYVVDSMQANHLIGVVTASDIIRVLAEKI
jgi:CBS domain containing-hemolysin-like protein